MQITKKEFQKIVKESVSKSEVCRKMGMHPNGQGLSKLKELLEHYSVDTSHNEQNSNQIYCFPGYPVQSSWIYNGHVSFFSQWTEMDFVTNGDAEVRNGFF